MSMSFAVRLLAPPDLEHLWAMNWDPLPRQISTFYLLCTIGHPRYCRVATAETGRIIGVLLATQQEANEWVYVNHLRVEPECRGEGVGLALMRDLEAACKADGVGRVWLLTSVDVETYYSPQGYRRDSSFMPPTVRQLMSRHRPDTVILTKVL